MGGRAAGIDARNMSMPLMPAVSPCAPRPSRRCRGGCGVADIVLAMLTRADELCEIAEASGAHMTKVAEAMVDAFKKEEAE
jgi:hypothetical protein